MFFRIDVIRTSIYKTQRYWKQCCTTGVEIMDSMSTNKEKSRYSSGVCALKFAQMLEELGVKPAHLHNAQSNNPDIIEDIAAIMLGHAKIVRTRHIIDCTAKPTCKNRRYDVLSWSNYGIVDWDASKVSLKDLKELPNNLSLSIFHRRCNEKFLGLNELNYLLRFPEAVPADWSTNVVFLGSYVRGCVGCNLHDIGFLTMSRENNQYELGFIEESSDVNMAMCAPYYSELKQIETV